MSLSAYKVPVINHGRKSVARTGVWEQ